MVSRFRSKCEQCVGMYTSINERSLDAVVRWPSKRASSWKAVSLIFIHHTTVSLKQVIHVCLLRQTQPLTLSWIGNIKYLNVECMMKIQCCRLNCCKSACCIHGWLDSHVVGHSNRDSTVLGLNHSRAVLLGNNLGQVVHTHLPSRSQWPSGGVPGCGVRDCRQCTYRDSHSDRQSWARAAAPFL